MILRPALPHDAPAIKACAWAAFEGYIPLIGRAPAPIMAPFADQIARGHIHLAEINRVVGYVTFYPIGPTMEVEVLAVLPEVKGQGIGKALLHHCEATAKAMGLRKMTLYTNAAMSQNLSLYPHLGYLEVDRRSEDGFQRVYCEKPLA